MGLYSVPINTNVKWISAHTTLTVGQMQYYSTFICDTAAKNLTLPSPSKTLAEEAEWIVRNTSDGSVTLVGTFVEGSSVSIGTLTQYKLTCTEVTDGVYKWGLVASTTAIPSLGETIADTVGAMMTGNTETMISVDYQDLDNTIDFVVAKATGAEITTGTEDAKVVTPKAIADSDVPTAIASGAEVNTGTDNAKFVTAKAIADSDYIKNSDISLSASVFGGAINSASAKATPIEADLLGIADTADSNLLKKVTFTEARAVLLSADKFGSAIAGYAAKASPIDADSIVICDSADTNDAKETTISELRNVMFSADGWGGRIAALAAKATPIDADSIAICDSADTNDAKEVTLSELRNALFSADGFGGRIAALAAKSSPIDADSIAICDSADTNDAKEVTIGELRSVLLASDPLGTAIAALDAKATPIGADSLVLVDSADTNNAKEVTVTALTNAFLGTALSGSINWADWVPTIASVPATDTLVARYARVGNSVKGYIDVRGSDGDGWTPSTITLPVAPVDVNARVPIIAHQKVDAAAATDMMGYVDAETGLNIKFDAAAACTDTKAWQIYIWFEYEVAAA